jgi:hypothetical protein
LQVLACGHIPQGRTERTDRDGLAIGRQGGADRAYGEVANFPAGLCVPKGERPAAQKEAFAVRGKLRDVDGGPLPEAEGAEPGEGVGRQRIAITVDAFLLGLLLSGYALTSDFVL